MTNKKGIPLAIKNVEGREKNSYKIFWEKEEGKLSIHSYTVQNKSKGLKNVVMLSTIPPILGTSKDDQKKPALYKVYDFSKGGTDIVDQRMESYSTRSNSRRWTLHAFAYMCDTARINAQTLLALNTNADPRKIDSYVFGWYIVNELVKPHLRIRKQSKKLNKNILRKIEDILEEEKEAAPEPNTKI